jgi:hypothetical protein
MLSSRAAPAAAEVETHAETEPTIEPHSRRRRRASHIHRAAAWRIVRLKGALAITLFRQLFIGEAAEEEADMEAAGGERAAPWGEAEPSWGGRLLRWHA